MNILDKLISESEVEVKSQEEKIETIPDTQLAEIMSIRRPGIYLGNVKGIDERRKEIRRKSQIIDLLPLQSLINLDKNDYFFNDLSRILINEIKKPKRKVKLTIKDKLSNSQRNIERISKFLHFLPGFNKFTSYYSMDEESIKFAAGQITYKRYEKGNYVFRQDDKSDYFYGIISGQVSIRERKKLINKKDNKYSLLPTSVFHTYLSYFREAVANEISETIEEEKLLLKAGQCFGEWGMIYNKDRIASAYCVEDCDLFMLDFTSFDLCFSRCMTKAELDRKALLKKVIPFFTTITKSRFDALYKSFIAKFLSLGEYIYREGDKAESVYVIYQGLCSQESKSLINKRGNLALLYLESGTVIGLEALAFGKPKKSKIKQDICIPPVYSTSVKCEEDNIVVIEIKINELRELRKPFCSSLRNLKEQKETMNENLMKEKNRMKTQTTIVFREESINNIARSKMPKDDEVYENATKIIEQPRRRVSKIRSVNFSIKKLPKNSLAIIKNLIKEDDVQVQLVEAYNTFNSTVKIPELKISKSPNIFKLKLENINSMNNLNTLHTLNTDSNNINSPNYSTSKKKPVKLFSKDVKDFLDKESSMKETIYCSEQPSITLFNQKPTRNFRGGLSKLKLTNTNVVSSTRFHTGRDVENRVSTSQSVERRHKESLPEDLSATIFKSVKKQQHLKSNESNVFVSKNLLDNIYDWSNALKGNKFRTGKFNIPLIYRKSITRVE